MAPTRDDLKHLVTDPVTALGEICKHADIPTYAIDSTASGSIRHVTATIVVDDKRLDGLQLKLLLEALGPAQLTAISIFNGRLCIDILCNPWVGPIRLVTEDPLTPPQVAAVEEKRREWALECSGFNAEMSDRAVWNHIVGTV